MDVSAASDPLLNNGLRPHTRVQTTGAANALARARNVQVSTRTPDVQSIPKTMPKPTPQIYMEAAHPPVKGDHPPAIAAMFADWGKADSPHDLNGDGNVGIRDFFDLMKQMSEDPGRAQVDALFRDWGRTEPSSPHDLDGDGQVGIRDFFDLMRTMSDASRQESAQKPAAPAPNDAPPEAGAPEVSMEVTQEPATQPAQTADQPQPDPTPRRGLALGLMHRLHEAYGRAVAENVARSMMPLLATAEPDELRASLDKAEVPRGLRQHVLDRLAAWNPRGVSFNAVG